jgi:hypothetical protein
MKKCKKCNIEKDLTEFYKQKKGKFGVKPECKDCIKEYNKLNSEHQRLYFKNYRQNNKEHIAKIKKDWEIVKRKTDSLYRLKQNLRHRTNSAFKSKYWQKNNTTQNLLSCTFEEAKRHIEIKFTEGMNWENYGKWHIDHIIPLSSANTEQELCDLFHYTNLQPLWAADNFKKSDKLI